MAKGNMKDIFRVLLIASDAPALANIRILEPYINLKSDIKFIYDNKLDEVWDESGNIVVDAVVFQRAVDPLSLKFIKEFKGKVITIVETDDDLCNVPFSNPVYPFMYDDKKKAKVYGDCLIACDYIHCSTPELAMGDKSTVFYNALDLKKYSDDKREEIKKEFRKKHNIPDGVKVIAFSGSTTHYQSLLLIKDTINELLKDDNIRVSLTSNIEWLRIVFPEEHKNLILTGWVSFDEAYKIPAIADITLVPLPDGKFNSCKSELKIIESAAWKMPCISSSVAPYERFNRLSQGGNILIKKERTRDWLKAIYGLLENDYLYDALATKSYKAVEDHYSLGVVNKNRELWWKKLSQ